MIAILIGYSITCLTVAAAAQDGKLLETAAAQDGSEIMSHVVAIVLDLSLQLLGKYFQDGFRMVPSGP